MFIPLHDANEFRYIRVQYVTMAIIAVNVVVYLMTTLGSEDFVNAAVFGFGYIPSTIFDIAERPPEMVIVPDDWTFLTYSFLHGDIWHLGGNMLFLWVFGDNVEDALGHFRYLIFYFACAAAGALMHGLIAPDSEAPLIGASGAIAGIVAAYLILHPRVKVWVLALGRIPLRLPAWILLALWIAFQFAMIFIGGDESISWAAHVGGIIAGAVLVLILRRRPIPIADEIIVTPRAVEVERPVSPEAEVRSPWGRH